MMGSKERHFAPLINVSLEDLVPADHFYRHLSEHSICRLCESSCKRPMQAKVVPRLTPLSSSNCNWSCFLRTSAPSASSCDMQQIDSAFAGLWGMISTNRFPIIPA